jgi:hypothetical protein
MGIESVGSRGPICSTPEDEAAPTPAAAVKAAPSGPPPVKDEVVEARDSTLDWLSSHLKVGDRLGGFGGEAVRTAAAGQKDAFGVAPKYGFKMDLKVADTGNRSIKHDEIGDAQNGASYQLGSGRASGQVGISRTKDGGVSAEAGGSARIAAARFEQHATQTLGTGPNQITVNEQVELTALSAEMAAKAGLEFGEKGVKGSGAMGAQVSLFEARLHAGANFHLDGYDMGGVSVDAAGGLGAGVKAKVEAQAKDGHLKFTSEAAAAVGLLGKLGVNVDVNVVEVARAVHDGKSAAIGGAAVATGAALGAGIWEDLGKAADGEAAKLDAQGDTLSAATLQLYAKGAQAESKTFGAVSSWVQERAQALAKK